VTAISVSTVIGAPPERVWHEVEDIGSHVRWMEDAVAIRFTSPARSGVGATFICDTRLGPMRLTDRMEVTEWDAPRRLGIRHVGIVTGSGRFRLEGVPEGTRFTWEEDLAFPWWAGGNVGGAALAPLLQRVWRRSLANLKALVERGPAV
jgi:polyketide cyclase/dehydrase/lipid transport protein